MTDDRDIILRVQELRTHFDVHQGTLNPTFSHRLLNGEN